MGLDIFENEGILEEGCVEDWGFSVHFGLGFQENSINCLHFTLMFWLRYYKMVQSLGMVKLV